MMNRYWGGGGVLLVGAELMRVQRVPGDVVDEKESGFIGLSRLGFLPEIGDPRPADLETCVPKGYVGKRLVRRGERAG